jgi:hypothetical protein
MFGAELVNLREESLLPDCTALKLTLSETHNGLGYAPVRVHFHQ